MFFHIHDEYTRGNPKRYWDKAIGIDFQNVDLRSRIKQGVGCIKNHVVQSTEILFNVS